MKKYPKIIFVYNVITKNMKFRRFFLYIKIYMIKVKKSIFLNKKILQFFTVKIFLSKIWALSKNTFIKIIYYFGVRPQVINQLGEVAKIYFPTMGGHFDKGRCAS